MQSWNGVMREGNEYFHDENWCEAEKCYKNAIHLIEMEMITHPETQSLFAWICGFHNLSTLYEAQNQLEKALEALLIPHHTMLTHLQDTHSALRQSAQDGLRLTLPPILSWAQRHPTCDECLSELIRQTQLLQNQIFTLH